MSHSNRGLNEPFYKWIDDVRRAIRKEKELQEKLEFYNMKLIGYKGVSYDRIGSSGSRSSGDSELMYWIDKIELVENSLVEQKAVIRKYNEFNLILTSLERRLLEEKIMQVSENFGNSLSRSLKHQYFNIIVRKWKIFYPYKIIFN